MLKELNRVAKQVAKIREKYSFIVGIDARYFFDGKDNFSPYIQVNHKAFWDMAEKAKAKIEKGYYFEGNRQYYFNYDGVKYFMLSEEEEN